MMGIISGIVIFLIIWWTALFVVLPFQIKRDDQGRPDDPLLKKKFMQTTALSAILWIIIFLIIESDLISFREMALALVK